MHISSISEAISKCIYFDSPSLKPPIVQILTNKFEMMIITIELIR
jgi:hypothetical protein